MVRRAVRGALIRRSRKTGGISARRAGGLTAPPPKSVQNEQAGRALRRSTPHPCCLERGARGRLPQAASFWAGIWDLQTGSLPTRRPCLSHSAGRRGLTRIFAGAWYAFAGRSHKVFYLRAAGAGRRLPLSILFILF